MHERRIRPETRNALKARYLDCLRTCSGVTPARGHPESRPPWCSLGIPSRLDYGCRSKLLTECFAALRFRQREPGQAGGRLRPPSCSWPSLNDLFPNEGTAVFARRRRPRPCRLGHKDLAIILDPGLYTLSIERFLKRLGRDRTRQHSL
jgi:hypothetical protein